MRWGGKVGVALMRGRGKPERVMVHDQIRVPESL